MRDPSREVASEPTRIFYWVHTWWHDGDTRVQRVVRSLGKALALAREVRLVPVQWCGEREALVVAEKALVEGLGLFDDPQLAALPDAGKPLHLARAGELDGAWLLIPDVPQVDPDPTRQAPVPVVLDYARYYGLRSACIFYDLAPLQVAGMRDAYAAYALALAGADVVLPISGAAGLELEAWWGEAGHDIDRLSKTRPVPLPAEIPGVSRHLATWEDYGSSILDAIWNAPQVLEVVVLEGSLGGSEQLALDIEMIGTKARRLRWRTDTKALIPAASRVGDPPARPGSGDFRGLWAILPVDTARNVAEVMQMQDEAHGLGLRTALVFPSDRRFTTFDLSTFPRADLSLFASRAQRDLALEAALLHLPKTATLRQRCAIAAGAKHILSRIHAERPATTSAGVPRRPQRIYYWVSLTTTQPFNTGVQRVVRALGVALLRAGVEVIPVKLGPDGRLATLTEEETKGLAAWGGPICQPNVALPASLEGEWLLHPEITCPSEPPGSNVPRFARSLGMHVAAIFFDLIVIKQSENYPTDFLDAVRAYLYGFSDADVALPISCSVVGDLRRFLDETGLKIPQISICALAGNLPHAPRCTVARAGPDPDGATRFLAIGTIEPRKNYLRLVRALIKVKEMRPSESLELTIVGRSADFYELESELKQLVDAAGTVTLLDHLADEDLEILFDKSHATVFASYEEGFGLPVLESLWQGLPCLCHNGSSLAEVAPGGGTLMVDMLDVDAIAEGLARLASEDGLLARLSEEAVARPIRSWDTYASDVLLAMQRTESAPGWTLPSVSVTGRARPLLSCAITTYNRAPWLSHSLPRLMEAAKPFGSAVEIVVCDNTSTDETPEVVAGCAEYGPLTSLRNPVNVGRLGNLGATARAANGHYIWLLGDDDLVLESGLKAVVEGLETYPDVEMAYMNYACADFDRPQQLSDPLEIAKRAEPIGYGGANRRVQHLREVAALNESLFTAIHACAFRRDHALRAYQQDTSGAPFSSLATCVPSSTYALAALQDRPAWWVGEPALVVNMNVPWLRWALLWHLERMPDLFDMAELAGIDPVRIDRHRHKHCHNAGEWVRAALLNAEDDVRTRVSVARLIERCKHMPSFRSEASKVFQAYAEAWEANRVAADRWEPHVLFERYGLSSALSPTASHRSEEGALL